MLESPRNSLAIWDNAMVGETGEFIQILLRQRYSLPNSASSPEVLDSAGQNLPIPSRKSKTLQRFASSRFEVSTCTTKG